MSIIRVLHVVGNMGTGGMETLIMNLYRMIDRSQIQFDFLVHSSKKAFYEDEIISLGGKVYHLTFLDDKNYIKYRQDLNNFFREHKEYKVVHGHHSSLGCIYLKYAKKNGVPYRVAHSHIASFSPTIKGVIKFIITRFFKKNANVLYACSYAAGRYMFGKKREFTIIPNAINVKDFLFDEKKRREIRRRMNLKEDTFVIGHIGRFHDQKNHVFILDVFAKLLQKNPNAILILIGKGPLLDTIKVKAEKLGIFESVMFLGVRGDVNELLQAMDVFFFPSLYEGLPLALVEAQASGLPIVCSDTITLETKMSDDYKVLSLNTDISVWVNQLLTAKCLYREDAYKSIIENGFDIQELAIKLEKKYADLHNQAQKGENKI